MTSQAPRAVRLSPAEQYRRGLLLADERDAMPAADYCELGPVGGHSDRKWCRTHGAYVESFGLLGLHHVGRDESHSDVLAELRAAR